MIVAPAAPQKAGNAQYSYVFTGFAGYTDGMVLTGDVTFTATYNEIVNQYTYTFVADGKTVQNVTANYGTAIVAPTAPAKNGYTFAGWQGYTNGMTLTKDVTFTAVYEKQNVTVQEPTLYLDYVNLSFRDALCIKYMARGEKIGNAVLNLLVWREAQDSYTVDTAEQILTTVGYSMVGNVKYLVFDYTGIAMKEMGDVVYARPYTVVDGEAVYGDVLKYSVLDYIYYCLGKTGAGLEDEEYLTFLQDLLRAGASAQKYFDYSEDRLVTDDFYQVKLEGGTFADHCSKGLYLENEILQLFAPAVNENGDLFSHWEDQDGHVINGDFYVVEARNVILRAVYEQIAADEDENAGEWVPLG